MITYTTKIMKILTDEKILFYGITNKSFKWIFLTEEIKLAKRGRRKKNKIDINIAVVVLVLLSILLMILIYTKSGSVGATLSPMLGGVMGFIKYIIPIGMLLIAIYMTHNDKEYLVSKLIQYGIF